MNDDRSDRSYCETLGFVDVINDSDIDAPRVCSVRLTRCYLKQAAVKNPVNELEKLVSAVQIFFFERRLLCRLRLPSSMKAV